MKSAYNNPDLVQKHDDLFSETLKLQRENDFLRHVISIMLLFSIAIGTALMMWVIIFYGTK